MSAIVPCYNGERYLAEAIRSILRQEAARVEVIIVDDGSTDRSGAVIRSFGDAVHHCHQPHAGAAAARNRGVELAQGEYLTFLDADDLWVEGALRRLTTALVADPTLGMVLGHTEQFISPDLAETAQRQFHFDPEPVPARICGAVLVRRAAFERVGSFACRWVTGEFMDWFLRAEELGVTSVMLPGVVLRRRLHRSNHGVVRRDARHDYLRVIKAALDRRRPAGSIRARG